MEAKEKTNIGMAAPQNLGSLDFLGSKRNLGKANFKRSLHVCVCVVCLFFFSKREIFYFETEVIVVRPVKFTRDSGCLVYDEFLVNFKGDHILIYMHIIAILLLLGTVSLCTT